MKEPNTVFIGRNKLTLSAATMKSVLEDWLHVNIGGGPYQVLTVRESNNGYGSDQYEIEFDAVEKKDLLEKL